MLGYSLELAWRGLRRFPRITILSVLALALGMGATIAAHTVTRLLAGNPLPSRAGELYAVRMTAPTATAAAGADAQNKRELPDKLTLLDVQRLEAVRPKTLQTAVINTMQLDVKPATEANAMVAASVNGLEVQSAFFRMFDVPLVTGHAWTHADDVDAAPVAVISSSLAEKLFGTTNAAGKSFRIFDKVFQVVGVSGPWKPYPHFYDLGACIYACPAEEVFVPISTARAQGIFLNQFSVGGECGSTSGPNAAVCPYLGFWTLLPNASAYADYRQMLANYADTQKAAGRFSRGGMNATGLQSVSEYLSSYHVVPLSVRLAVWVAVVFLLVCLVNVAGLLLTRFLRNSAELGIRRALGASRRAIFAHCLGEAGLLGLIGGLLALPLAWVGLWLVKQQPVAYASVIGLDWSACLALLMLAVLSSMAIGLIPAWRASLIEPGLQIREL